MDPSDVSLATHFLTTHDAPDRGGRGFRVLADLKLLQFWRDDSALQGARPNQRFCLVQWVTMKWNCQVEGWCALPRSLPKASRAFIPLKWKVC